MKADAVSASYRAEEPSLTPEADLQDLCNWVDVALDHEALISRLVEEVRERLGAQKALFFLAEPTDGGIQLRERASEEIISLPGSEPFVDLMAQPGLYPLDASCPDSPFCRRMMRDHAAELALVFASRDRPHGLVLFGNLSEPFSSHSESLKEFQRVANRGTLLLEQASLRERCRQEALEKNILLEVVKQMSASLDLPHVVNTIIDVLRAVVPYDGAVIFLIDKKSGEIEQLVHRGYREAGVEKLRLKIGEGVSGWVAKTGEPVIVPDVTADPRYVEAQPSTRSEIAVPLVHGGDVIGVFNLESDRPAAFEKHHLRLLEAFASQAAVAIEHARLHQMAVQQQILERELRFAREIQNALLPKRLPRAKHLSLSALNIPSRHVSGDLYDAIQFADGRIGMAIGDVSGKGTPGAILMATLYALYRSEVRRGLPAHKLMARLNRRFLENRAEGSFATFFHAVLDPATLGLEYCNAGHNPPLLLRADGTVEFLRIGGLILGVTAEVRYERKTVHLAPGDLLLLYTDGVTEAESPEEELFGVDRLVATLRELADLRISAIKRKILETITDFTGSTPLEDDFTIFLLKVRQ